MEKAALDFDTRLETSWNAYFARAKDNHPESKLFLEENVVRELDEGKVVAFYNKQHDVNRFFTKKGEEEEEGNDSFNLDEELSVFKNVLGDKESDLLKENDKEILFYLDLENEEVVDKEERNEIMEGAQTNLEEERNLSVHPVLINQYPLCKNHSIFLLFADEALPQLLSDELLGLLLQVFKFTNNGDIRIGYNSMGADCWVNNLHFHFVNTTALFEGCLGPKGSPVFPIERAQQKLFYSSSLKHRNQEEINMYSFGVNFYETTDWPLRTFVVRPQGGGEQKAASEEGMGALEEGGDVQASLSHAVGVLLSLMVDRNVPHNVMIAEGGLAVYLVPRKFDLLIEDSRFFTGFDCVCGLVKCKDKATFDGLNYAGF